MPSHYQSHCWIIVNWRLQWNENENASTFIKKANRMSSAGVTTTTCPCLQYVVVVTMMLKIALCARMCPFRLSLKVLMPNGKSLFPDINSDRTGITHVEVKNGFGWCSIRSLEYWITMLSKCTSTRPNGQFLINTTTIAFIPWNRFITSLLHLMLCQYSQNCYVQHEICVLNFITRHWIQFN